MNRGFEHMKESDFREVYCRLSSFTEIYDNGEEHIPFVLDGIVDAYLESLESQHQHMSKEEARRLLAVPIKNARGAGRKPRYSEQDLLEMVQMYDAGESFKDIAAKFECSSTYVRTIVKEHGMTSE